MWKTNNIYCWIYLQSFCFSLCPAPFVLSDRFYISTAIHLLFAWLLLIFLYLVPILPRIVLFSFYPSHPLSSLHAAPHSFSPACHISLTSLHLTCTPLSHIVCLTLTACLSHLSMFSHINFFFKSANYHTLSLALPHPQSCLTFIILLCF